ncbi:MAG TPA: type II toxin-antitoxin system VapC family toxin [Verrucomicrobiales bacterium]|jgi:predicted nucleic acid-binding protein|nr:type II toxin-antitoxin system VapC family toxin [Verrucomicrobiales bacterium]
MTPYADSSFIISLIVKDCHTATAWSVWRDIRVEIMLSYLTELEVAATLHRLKVTGELSPEKFAAAALKFDRMLLDGELARRKVPPHQLYPQAHTLVNQFSGERAFKSLDILHVASAMTLHADTFLTFDDQQGDLAKIAGLSVLP